MRSLVARLGCVVLAGYLAAVGCAMLATVATAQETKQPENRFVGRVERTADTATPRPVRNEAAKPGEEIVTLRYFRIKKGSYDQVSKISREGVWPYFEKIGARSIGMWQVVTPEGLEGAPAANKDYEEVYMMTRYASLDHWKATRDAVALGGNGPDWAKCREALNLRSTLTLSTNVIFLKGGMAVGGPYFMPALSETYEKK